MEAYVDRLLDEFGVYELFDFEGEVAEDHREREILHRSRSRVSLCPLTLWIRAFFEYPVECLLRDLRVFVVSGSHCQLCESHGGECVGEDVVRVYDGLALARQGEVPVVFPVVSVFP